MKNVSIKVDKVITVDELDDLIIEKFGKGIFVKTIKMNKDVYIPFVRLNYTGKIDCLDGFPHDMSTIPDDKIPTSIGFMGPHGLSTIKQV